MRRLIASTILFILFFTFEPVSDGVSQTAVKKFQGFLGTYHPYRGTAYGGGGWREGELMQSAFDFGQNAILNNASRSGYTFEQNFTNSCSEWDVNKVYGILLPPSERGVVNQPTDSDLLKPFARGPGMVQGMHRFSELSKSCPQIDGVIIDDLYNDFPKTISVEDLRDMKDALSGKRIDDKGNVDQSSPATTPHLKLYFVVYEHHLDIVPDPKVLDLIDGVNLWLWKQSDHYKNFDDYIKTVQKLYPRKTIIAGVYVLHSQETPSVESVHYVMKRAIDLYSKGQINGLLMFSAIWMSREQSAPERWEQLALPAFLAGNYYASLGEARGRIIDAQTKQPIAHALVSVDRSVNGKTQNVTSKFTNERGEYRFGGWAGAGAGSIYSVSVSSPGARRGEFKMRLRSGEVVNVRDFGLRK